MRELSLVMKPRLPGQVATRPTPLTAEDGSRGMHCILAAVDVKYREKLYHYFHTIFFIDVFRYGGWKERDVLVSRST